MSDVVVIQRQSVVTVVAAPTPGIIVTEREAPMQIVIQREGIPGKNGVAGAAGGTTFQYTQSDAALIWNISHNLGRFPSVTIVDNAGREVWGDVTFLDANLLSISFDLPMSGIAYLN